MRSPAGVTRSRDWCALPRHLPGPPGRDLPVAWFMGRGDRGSSPGQPATAGLRLRGRRSALPVGRAAPSTRSARLGRALVCRRRFLRARGAAWPRSASSGTGDSAAGIAGLDRALAENRDTAARPLMLAAKVEIALAAGLIDAARTALADLEQTAEAIQTPYLAGLRAHAAGQLRMADGDAQAALSLLRRA